MNIDIGTNYATGERVFIDETARARHTYINGQTGTGKSVLLENIAAQLAQNGEGFAFLDPHGEAVDELLYRIPKSRADHIALIDLADLPSPVGLNILAGVEPDRRALVVDNLVSSFVHIFGETAVADRSQMVLRNALLAEMHNDDCSLVTVVLFIRDDSFREKRLEKVTLPLVRSYFEHEFAEPKYREAAVPPILNKLDALLSHPALCNTLAQNRCSVNFRKVMDERRILLVQLRSGILGEAAAYVMGSLIFSAILRAAFSRADTPEADRASFAFIVDEMQNFVGPYINTTLSEARKYRLELFGAHQYLAQMRDILPAVWGNTGTFISFRPGYDDAVVLHKQFQTEAPSQFLDLPNYRARVRPLKNGVPTDPIAVITHPRMPRLHEDTEGLRQTARRFAADRLKVERHITHLFKL